MSCKYSLEIGGVVKLYGTYAELFNDLLNNLINIEENNINDIVFSELSKLAETIALINKIQSTADILLGLYNGNSGEIEEKVGQGFMSISDYVETAKKTDGSVFITPYKEADLKQMMLNYLTTLENMPNLEAAIKVAKDLETGKLIADKAAKLHAVVRAYFNGAHDKESLYKMFGEEFDLPIIEKIILGLSNVESMIKLKHGDDVKVLAGIKLQSKIIGEPFQLLGAIDLIAVDNKGQAHIYYMKGSSKAYANMIDVRLRKLDYILAFQRHMLASKGIAARDMSLNIIPVRMLGLENGVLQDVIFELIEDRQAITNKEGINRLQWGSGPFYDDVNTKIDVKMVAPSTISSDFRDNVISKLLKMVPGKRIRTLRHEKSREEFMKNVMTNSDEKGAYYFIDRIANKPVYIKDPSPKEGNAELITKIDSYLTKEKKASFDSIHNFENILDSVLKGTVPINKLSPREEAIPNLEARLSLYITGDWEVAHNEQLEQLGIISLVNKVSKQVDIISLSYYPAGSLNTVINLPLGDTMLGLFRKNYEVVNSKYLLKASNGNIDLMKVMIALNEMSEWFNGIFKIGNISVVDIYNGLGTEASTKEIVSTFSSLCKETGIKNNLESMEFVSDLELFKQSVISVLNKKLLSSDVATDIFADLERINPQNSKAALKILYNIAYKMRSRYPTLDTNMSGLAKANSELLLTYYLLMTTIAAYEGEPLTQILKSYKYSGSIREGKFLSGTDLTNPATVTEHNLRKMTSVVRKAFNNMTLEISDEWEPFRNKVTAELWDAKGFTWVQNNLVGNLKLLYDNMFETNSKDGLINNMLILKNPYDPNSKLDEAERKYLKDVLWRINKLRFNLTSESDPKVAELKKTEKWYWLPLTEATLGSKVQQTKPTSYFKKELSDIGEFFKGLFRREENGEVYNAAEEAALINHRERYLVFNRFSLSDNNLADRTDLLNEHDINFWERNIETVYAKYLYAHIRKKHLDLALSLIKAYKIHGLLQGNLTGEDTSVYDEYIDKYLKSSVHNLTLFSDEGLMPYLGPLKKIASFAALGFNVTSGVRSTLEGLWKVPSRIMSKYFAGKDMFTASDWARAVGIMIEDVPDFAQRVTLIEALNVRFRIQGVDSNRIAQNLISNKNGLLNAADRWAFWFVTAPDYFNRMSMLIALMIHDGTWEACSFDKNGFHYDWKKDKRFSVYASGNTKNPEYNKQRGLYLFLMNTINQDRGLNLKEGDALPLPYTNAQIDALKNFSDTVYGFYDHDLKALVERGAITSLFSQFKTYLTASRTMWLLSPDGYNLGEVLLLTDEKTGEPLYLKEVEDEDGEKIWVPTTEVTGIPMYGPVNSYLEGIVYTLVKGYDAFKSGGIKNMWNELLSLDVRRNNLKLFAYNMSIMLLIAPLLRYLFLMWGNYRDKEAEGKPKTLSSVAGDLFYDTFSKAIMGSVGDFNIIDSILDVSVNSDPVAFSILSRLYTSTGEVISGDQSLGYWLHTNVGAYRSVEKTAQGLYDIYLGAEGSLEQASKS